MPKLLEIWLLLLLLAGLLLTTLIADKAVQFSDQNLELEIRILLDNYSKPIYQSQLNGFLELDLSGKKISDISGLEHFRHLEVLNLENNFISDFSPLSTLNNLRILNLSNNGISNLEETQFNSLTHIHLVELYMNSTEILSSYGRRNRLTDISLLENFQDLEVLELHGNLVNDLGPVSNLTKLRALNLGENQIQTIAPLVNLKALEDLDLRYNQINDLSVLSNLQNLSILNLRHNRIEDISPLEGLNQLDYLNIHSNLNIQDIKPLAELTQLSELIMRNVPVGDQVWVFKNMTSLKRLNVANCAISDYSIFGLLMKTGALQNNPNNGSDARLTIRDNILLQGQGDPLAALRPYWENIADRDPVNLPRIDGLVETPVLSQDGGYFTEEFQLTMATNDPNLEIYYTLDGSDPEPHQLESPKSPYQTTNKYTEPIKITTRSNDKNLYSAINTTHVENQVPWKPPKGNVYKGQTVRAIAYDPQRKIKSQVKTNTYFVDEEIYQRYPDLPVISLTADYDFLFDPDSGILNTGRGDNPFYHSEARVPANIEWFEPDGSIGFNGLYEIKLHGFTSVANPQKGFHVYAEPWLGEETIQYPIFQNAESKANQIEHFDRFVLRAWGSALGWDVFFSDAYHQTLMAKSDLDIQGYQPVILFINGEYWGLYAAREANKNQAYFEGHYYQNQPADLDILELGTIDFIQEGDPDHWKALMAFIYNHDLSLDENYDYVKTQIDIDNFIQYIIHSSYTGKKDWPGHNEAIWRPRTNNGKWRWIQFDMDQGLRAGVDNLYDMVGHVMEDGAVPHPLLIALLENENFQIDFLNTFAHLTNTYFRTSVEIAHFTQMAETLEPYIPEFIDRWQLEMDWQENKNQALLMIEDRYVFRKNQILDNFSVSGTFQVQVLTDSAQGQIAINGFPINQETPGVSDPGNWTGRYFKNIPITFTAIPKSGFRFVRWERSAGIDPNKEEFSAIFDGDVILEAVFVRE